jgi:hypothetical protein|tara:strand:- start:1313 stop:3178 length:1866 start_codon:yes stop_codon:yes gene_type:complete
MADTSLFGRLKRLFSTQVVVRRTGKDKLKVVDSSRLQSDGNRRGSAYYDRYGRLHGSNSRKNWQTYNERFNYHSNKLELYTDYEAMDKDSIISSILDIYSDECTLKNDMGDVIRIKSNDEKLKKTLHNLFYDVLNIEFNLWSWVRGMNKYGDYYLFLDIDDELGVVNAQPLSCYETRREEGYDLDNPYSVRFEVEEQNTNAISQRNNTKFLESFQVAHFRLLTDTNFLPYGRSLLEGARKTWKQLTLMEDAMMIHRIMRAPEKRIFKIDIGNIPPAEVDTYMASIIDQMKKVPYIDETTGDYNLKFNMQNMMEDYYLPVRGGQSGTEIDSLSGMEFGGIDDIEYLRNRMLAALKVPKAFIGYEEGVEGKATLAQEDIRFARSVERIQKIVLSELTKIAIVHLYSQGYTDDQLVNFELQLTNPSIIYEQEKANLWSEKISLASDIKDLKMVSQDWVYKNIFNMSEDEWKEEQFKVINDLKLQFRHEQIESEGNDPVKTGESFGTPHDLATLQQSGDDSDDGQFGENKGGAPEGGFDGAGRPKEGGNYGTDENPFGRDPLGNKSLSKNERYNAKSVINKEHIDAVIGRMKSKVKTKEMLRESLQTDTNETPSPLLDEKNILDS